MWGWFMYNTFKVLTQLLHVAKEKIRQVDQVVPVDTLSPQETFTLSSFHPPSKFVNLYVV